MNADRVAVYTRSEVQLERLNIENGSKQQRIGARGSVWQGFTFVCTGTESFSAITVLHTRRLI